MRILFMLAALAFSFVTAECQQVIYDENAEVRSVGKFNSIEVSGTVSLYISQGKELGVAVSAEDKKYNEKIKTEVKNDALNISVDGGMWNGFSWTNRKLKVYVSVNEISSLMISGACSVNTGDSLTVNALNLNVSGASEFKGNLQVKNLNITTSGASVLRLKGSADNVYIVASGACKINAFELRSDYAKVEASGASHITLTANKDFNASASGGSSVQYRGEASATTLNSAGGASIKKAN